MAKSFDELAARTMSAKGRAHADARTKELLGEMLLAEVRKLAGKSQAQLARRLGMKQPSLSKLENQEDMQISTLKKIVEALGGEIVITARFPEGDAKLKQFGNPKSANRQRELQLV